MIEEKYKKIIDKLVEKSKNVIWNKTSRDAEFKVILKTSTITTDRWVDEEGEDCVDFIIRNQRGDMIAMLMYSDKDDKEEYNYLRRLHDCAKNSYYKIEDTIEDIFNELDSENEIGEIEF